MNRFFISTGIPLLDQYLGGGFRKKGAYLIASEKKAGKSSFVRKLIFNLISLGRKVLLIDTEEVYEDILLCMSAIGKEKAVADLTEEDIKVTEELMDEMITVDCNQVIEELYVDGELDIDALEAFIKRKKDFGVEIVVFDNVTRVGVETSANARMRLMAQLVRLAKKYQLLILVIGHTPSSEVETLDKKLVDRVVETRQFDELLSTTQNVVQRPRDPYGGSATSQFDAVFIIWRPFQYYSLIELQQVAFLIVEQIRTASPFTLRMQYEGEKRLFKFIDAPEVSERVLGPIWKKA